MIVLIFISMPLVQCCFGRGRYDKRASPRSIRVNNCPRSAQPHCNLFVCCGPKHYKTLLPILVYPEINTATFKCFCLSCSNRCSPNHKCLFLSTQMDTETVRGVLMLVGWPKHYLASVPRSHFELHTAQFASPISHASLHMCARVHYLCTLQTKWG